MNFIILKSESRRERKREFYRLAVALSDIEAARNVCKLFLSTVRDLDHELYYPLFTSIVVCYARPFTENKTLGVLRGKWNKFSDSRLHNTHVQMLKARNEIIAHSDLHVRRVRIVPPGSFIGTTKNGNEIRRSASLGHDVSSYYFPMSLFPSVLDTCNDLGRRLDEAVEAEAIRLWGKLELPRAPFLIRFDEGL